MSYVKEADFVVIRFFFPGKPSYSEEQPGTKLVLKIVGARLTLTQLPASVAGAAPLKRGSGMSVKMIRKLEREALVGLFEQNGISPEDSGLAADVRLNSEYFSTLAIQHFATRWQRELKPFREALIRVEGVPPRQANQLLSASPNPVEFWSTVVWPDLQELIGYGATPRQAIDLILQVKDQAQRIQTVIERQPQTAPNPEPHLLPLWRIAQTTAKLKPPVSDHVLRSRMKKGLLIPDDTRVSGSNEEYLFDESRMASMVAQASGKDLWAPGQLVLHPELGTGQILAEKRLSDLRPGRVEVLVAFEGRAPIRMRIRNLRPLISHGDLWVQLQPALGDVDVFQFDSDIQTGWLTADGHPMGGGRRPFRYQPQGRYDCRSTRPNLPQVGRYKGHS